MENRTPKNRYNGGAAPDPGKSAGKPDALKLLETAMDKRAGDIAQTATDMFRFMSMASAMLPNMELDVGVFRLKIDDEGVFSRSATRTISERSSAGTAVSAGRCLKMMMMTRRD